MKKSKLLIILFSFLLIPFTSCEDGVTNSLNLNIFSVQDDVQLGKQLDSSIMANPTEYPMLNNSQVTNYVKGIVDEIIKSPEITQKDVFKYNNVKIINKNVLNAFCAPGGYIYVYTGLMKYVDNEATLAAILAHEIAHAERRHSTQRMTKQYGVSVLTSYLLGNNPSLIEQITSNMLSGLALLKNSRDNELESDEYSFKYLKTSKWFPGAGKYFFEKINAEKEGSGTKFDEILSTHPLDATRIQAIDKLIKDAQLADPTEANLFKTQYDSIKKILP